MTIAVIDYGMETYILSRRRSNTLPMKTSLLPAIRGAF